MVLNYLNGKVLVEGTEYYKENSKEGFGIQRAAGKEQEWTIVLGVLWNTLSSTMKGCFLGLLNPPRAISPGSNSQR